MHRPSLWVMYASALWIAHQISRVEQKLQAAEAAIAESAAAEAAIAKSAAAEVGLASTAPQGTEPDEKNQDLIGHIAAIRAMLAAPQRQVETIIAQSRRALEYLHPDNLPVRTAATWALGITYQFRGDRAAASQAYTEAISICEASGLFLFPKDGSSRPF